MGKRLSLPATVTLPCAPTVAAGQAYRLLGISRQVAHLWRKRGFPSSTKGMIDTSDLVQWLRSQGAVNISWV